MTDALEAYAARFGTRPGVWEFMADVPALVALLAEAVARGRPLTDAELHQRLGVDPLPEGAIP